MCALLVTHVSVRCRWFHPRASVSKACNIGTEFVPCCGMPVSAFLLSSSRKLGHSTSSLTVLFNFELSCTALCRSKLIALSAAEHLVAWRNGASSPLLNLRFGSLVEDAVVERVDQQRGLLLQLPNQEGVKGYARLFQLADEKVPSFVCSLVWRTFTGPINRFTKIINVIARYSGLCCR